MSLMKSLTFMSIRRISRQRKSIAKRLMAVPASVANHVKLCLDYKKLPWIYQMLSRPIIDRDFELINEGGYHKETGFYVDGARLPKINEEMTLEEAHDVISDWLIDFQFASEADFANAIAYGLTLILRSALPYGALPPLFLITSANPGSGKSTLANIMGIVATGQFVGATSGK